MSELLFRWRAPLSAANALILALLLAMALQFHPQAPRPAETATIELSLAPPAESPPRASAQAAAAAPDAAPQPRAAALARPLPSVPAPAAENGDGVSAIAAAPARTTEVLAPTAAATAAPPVAAGHEAEAGYVAKLRAYLQSIKRYPTGREVSLQRPSGTSTVWFLLARNGELLDAGIGLSSGSMLLDNAALATVRRGAYPSLPSQAWPGKAQQRFSVELDFLLAN